MGLREPPGFSIGLPRWRWARKRGWRLSTAGGPRTKSISPEAKQAGERTNFLSPGVAVWRKHLKVAEVIHGHPAAGRRFPGRAPPFFFFFFFFPFFFLGSGCRTGGPGRRNGLAECPVMIVEKTRNAYGPKSRLGRKQFPAGQRVPRLVNTVILWLVGSASWVWKRWGEPRAVGRNGPDSRGCPRLPLWQEADDGGVGGGFPFFGAIFHFQKLR